VILTIRRDILFPGRPILGRIHKRAQEVPLILA